MRSWSFVVASLASVEAARRATRIDDGTPAGPEDTFHEDDDADSTGPVVDTPVEFLEPETSDEFPMNMDAVAAADVNATSNPSPLCASSSAVRGRRVVSVADWHGDFDNMIDMFKRLKLISSTVSRSSSTWSRAWRGGNGIFVQTGDILDRGPDGRMMYQFLWRLQDDAPRSGGEVVLLPGNHELMVLQGDLRYVTDRDFCQYTNRSCSGSGNYPTNPCSYRGNECSSTSNRCMTGSCEFLESWDRNGEMGSEFRSRVSSGKIRLAYQINGMSFVHAGLVSSIWPKVGLQRGENAIDKVNAVARELFRRSTGLELRNSRSIITSGGSQGGPLWTRMCYSDWHTRASRRRTGRRYYMDDNEFQRVESSRCATVRASLDSMGAKRMVIGHCPQRDGRVKSECDGRYIVADTYMSRAYTGSSSTTRRHMAALEFYSGDTPGRAWVSYPGRGSCERLPSV